MGLKVVICMPFSSLLSVVIFDVLGNADGEAGGRNHHGRPGCSRFCDPVALGVYEALGFEHFIRFVKVVHIHADRGDILGNGGRSHVHVEHLAVLAGVAHPYAGDVCVVDAGFLVPPLKARSLKELDVVLRVFGDDQGG